MQTMKLFPLKRNNALVTGKRIAPTLALAGMIGLLAGCSTVGYYSQIVSGHMRIVMGKRPLAEIASDETSTTASNVDWTLLSVHAFLASSG